VRSSVLEIVQEDVPNDRGRVWADSQELSREGLSKGDVVYFSKNSDYEMEVDGTKVWRMLIGDLMYAEV
jgi:co-chaperonin GroES (HSP10)